MVNGYIELLKHRVLIDVTAISIATSNIELICSK